MAWTQQLSVKKNTTILARASQGLIWFVIVKNIVAHTNVLVFWKVDVFKFF